MNSRPGRRARDAVVTQRWEFVRAATDQSQVPPSMKEHLTGKVVDGVLEDADDSLRRTI
jgi:hypothetical protein